MKVLIVSPPFFGYQKSVGEAFKAIGYEVYIETFDEPVHPFKGWNKWHHKFSINQQKLRDQSKKKYNKYICSKYDTIQPNIVFTYNGTLLYSETLSYFRIKSKVLLWMYDSVQRPDRSQCINHIDHVDGFFCFDRKDINFFESIGKKAYFLPLACDTHVYFPIPEKSKDIDILFVGTIYTSPQRIYLLNQIVKKYPHLTIRIYGQYIPYYKTPVKWLFRRNRSVFKNVNIPPEKVNELFNRSKIALNIHHEQTQNGANQRVFEIAGSGAYQICDHNPFIESLFPNGEAGLYADENELFSCIDKALETNMSLNAQKAYEIIQSGHTFRHRVEEMLKVTGII